MPKGGLCLGVLEVWPVCQEDDAKASAASEPLSFAHEANGVAWGKGGYPKLKAQYIFAKKWMITYYYCIQHLHWPLCHATSGSINTELLIWFSQGWEKPGNTSTVRSKEPLTIGRPAEVGLVATRSACCFCLAVPSRPWHGGLAGSIQSFTFAIGLGRKGSWGIQADERGWEGMRGDERGWEGMEVVLSWGKWSFKVFVLLLQGHKLAQNVRLPAFQTTGVLWLATWRLILSGWISQAEAQGGAKASALATHSFCIASMRKSARNWLKIHISKVQKPTLAVKRLVWRKKLSVGRWSRLAGMCEVCSLLRPYVRMYGHQWFSVSNLGFCAEKPHHFLSKCAFGKSCGYIYIIHTSK